MAHVFKPTTVKPVPKNAVIVTVKGVRYAKWTNRRHKPVQAELTACGTKCRVPGPTWWVEYTDANLERARAKGFPSREATNHLATDLERQASEIRAGHTSIRRDSPAHLIDHLPAFRESLEEKGRSLSHVTSVLHNLTAVITAVNLTTPATVNCEAVSRWLASERKREGWSVANLNRYVQFLKQFGRWLVRTRRAAHNPFEELSRIDTNGEIARTRRRLPDEELSRLVAAAREGKSMMSLPGVDRARLYTLAAFTGFRMGTLARLTPEAFAWEGKTLASITAPGRLTKNKKPHTVPAHPSVAAELADWLRGRTPGSPIFPAGYWPRTGAEMVRHDLAVARAAWIAEAGSEKERARRLASDVLAYHNAAGDVFDFHALRVQFISGLAIAKVPLTAAQQLADHSTPTLTANIYTKWGPQELASEIAKLPGLRTSPVRVEKFLQLQEFAPVAWRNPPPQARKGKPTKRRTPATPLGITGVS